MASSLFLPVSTSRHNSTWIGEQTLTYKTAFNGKHNFGLVVGNTVQSNQITLNSETGRGFDKEYKTGVKEDIAALSKQMNEGFLKVDTRFEKVDERFEKVDARFDKVDARFDDIDDRLDLHDKRFDSLDNKIDRKTDELRIEIRDVKVEITRWIIGLILSLLAIFIAIWLKK
jgi:hypothetical protein